MSGELFYMYYNSDGESGFKVFGSTEEFKEYCKDDPSICKDLAKNDFKPEYCSGSILIKGKQVIPKAVKVVEDWEI